MQCRESIHDTYSPPRGAFLKSSLNGYTIMCRNGTRVNKDLVELISNRRTGPGTLEFMAKESIKVDQTKALFGAAPLFSDT